MALRPMILFWYGRYLTRRKRPARARHRKAWSAIGFLLAARRGLELSRGR
jgi:hypothetical protein